MVKVVTYKQTAYALNTSGLLSKKVQFSLTSLMHNKCSFPRLCILYSSYIFFLHIHLQITINIHDIKPSGLGIGHTAPSSATFVEVPAATTFLREVRFSQHLHGLVCFKHMSQVFHLTDISYDKG